MRSSVLALGVLAAAIGGTAGEAQAWGYGPWGGYYGYAPASTVVVRTVVVRRPYYPRYGYYAPYRPYWGYRPFYPRYGRWGGWGYRRAYWGGWGGYGWGWRRPIWY
jgi:hypothetical protein